MGASLNFASDCTIEEDVFADMILHMGLPIRTFYEEGTAMGEYKKVFEYALCDFTQNYAQYSQRFENS
jgi:hypothetical protein